MSDEKSVQAAMWLMIAIQTIGSVDLPGRGPRKLPAPRAYVAIVVAMGILQLLADAGMGAAAKAMAWTSVAAAAVLGPFGIRFVNLLNVVSSRFATAPISSQQLQTEVQQADQPVRRRVSPTRSQ